MTGAWRRRLTGVLVTAVAAAVTGPLSGGDTSERSFGTSVDATVQSASVASVAPRSAPRPCGRGAVDTPPAWMGSSTRTAVAFPSIYPRGPRRFAGHVYLPPVWPETPRRLPVLLLQHGTGGDACSLEWLARAAVGHGYLAVTWTAPGGRRAGDGESYANALRASASVYPWLRSSANPWVERTDVHRVVLGGSSLGSMSTSALQGTRRLTPGTRAIIALDNLRRWQYGDQGGAAWECGREQEGEVRPRVPALGFAMDAPCATGSRPRYREQKLSGLKHWRAARVPAMTLVMRGFSHTDFAVTGTDTQRRLLWYYIDAWLDRWVSGDRTAQQRLLARQVWGTDTADLLSRRFDSGAHVAGMDTNRLADRLARARLRR